MPVTHELMARAGSYTDRDGNEKTRWQKCGILIEKDGRLSVKLEALPIGFDGWLSCFEPRQDDKPQRPKQRQDDGSVGGMSDDIPFADPYKGRRSYVV